MPWTCCIALCSPPSPVAVEEAPELHRPAFKLPKRHIAWNWKCSSCITAASVPLPRCTSGMHVLAIGSPAQSSPDSPSLAAHHWAFNWLSARTGNPSAWLLFELKLNGPSSDKNHLPHTRKRGAHQDETHPGSALVCSLCHALDQFDRHKAVEMLRGHHVES